METWKELINTNVEVSKNGDVRSKDYLWVDKNGKIKVFKGKDKKLCDSHGYLVTCVLMKGKKRLIGVHVLVAMAFIENPENKHV